MELILIRFFILFCSDHFKNIGDECREDKECESIGNARCNTLERKCECEDSFPVLHEANMYCYSGKDAISLLIVLKVLL